MSITTAVREIERLAQDALRMMGVPFPAAERAMHAVTWAEAVHGRGLEFLMAREADIRATAAAVPRLISESDDAAVIDAGGASLLTMGPPALDLATALARTCGVGEVRVTRSFGLMFAGELVHWAAGRGLGCVAICSAPATDDPFELHGSFSTTPGALLRFRKTPAQSDAVAEMPTLILQCFAPGHVESIPVDGEDLNARFDAALRHGMKSPTAAFDHVAALALRIRQPTSERSRNQAG